MAVLRTLLVFAALFRSTLSLSRSLVPSSMLTVNSKGDVAELANQTVNGTLTMSSGASDDFADVTDMLTSQRNSSNLAGSIASGGNASRISVRKPPEIIRTREGERDTRLVEQSGLALTTVIYMCALVCLGVSTFFFEWVIRKVYTEDPLLFCKGNMPNITGLRGLAMLGVMHNHCKHVIWPYAEHPNSELRLMGGTCVFVFFVLSGFLMGLLYINKPFTFSNVWKYAVARASRIFPAYWVVVIATSFMSENHGLVLSCAMEFRGAAMQLWTVPVEVQFYAIFVFLWWAYSRAGLLPFIFVFILHLALFIIPVSGGPLLDIQECSHCLTRFCALQHVPTFCIGVVLGGRWDDIVRWFPGGRVLDAVGLLCFIGLPLSEYSRRYWWDDVLVSIGLSKGKLTQSLMPMDPLAYLFASGLLVAAAHSTPSLNFLSSRVLILCGNISFTCYLIHLQCFNSVALVLDGCPVWLRLVVLMLVSIVIFSIATLSLHFLEEPARRLGKKVG